MVECSLLSRTPDERSARADSGGRHTRFCIIPDNSLLLESRVSNIYFIFYKWNIVMKISVNVNSVSVFHMFDHVLLLWVWVCIPFWKIVEAHSEVISIPYSLLRANVIMKHKLYWSTPKTCGILKSCFTLQCFKFITVVMYKCLSLQGLFRFEWI